MTRARAEADSVLGADVAVLPSYAQVRKLTYLTQILEETLRLWPTAPPHPPTGNQPRHRCLDYHLPLSPEATQDPGQGRGTPRVR